MLSLVIYSIIGLSFLGLAAVMFFHLKKLIDEEEESDELTEKDFKPKKALPVTDIFHEFSHQSYKEWLKWIFARDTNTKELAFTKLVKHLEGDPKYWGFVTTEVLNAIAEFDNSHRFDTLVNFLNKIKPCWAEFKAVATYYETTCRILAKVQPEEAINLFQDEMKLKDTGKIAESRKKMLISAATLIEDNEDLVDFFTNIITNNMEVKSIKSHAIQSLNKVSINDRTSIVKNCLEDYIKYTETSLAVQESYNYGDIVAHCAKLIDRDGVFDLIAEACKSEALQDLTVKTLKGYIGNRELDIKTDILFNVYNLPDNADLDLRQALCLRAALNEKECEVAFELTPNIKSEKDLQSNNEEITPDDLPLPSIAEEEYKNFTENLLRDVDVNRNESNKDKKLQGGILLSGNSEFEKLYYARVAAVENQWSFIYVDIDQLNDKKKFDVLSEQISSAARPCSIYISNADQLYLKNPDNVKGPLINRLLHLLHLHSIDKRFYIIGSMEKNLAYYEANNKAHFAFLDNLKEKFFPFQMDIKEINNDLKHEIINNITGQLGSSRSFDAELINNIINECKGFSILQFYFYVLRLTHIMMLVFGEVVQINQVKQMEDQYFSYQLGSDKKKKKKRSLKDMLKA